MTFGEKVRELRKKRNLSQEDLTRMIGCSSKSMISKIERGQRGTPIPVVTKLAKALGVSVSELIGEDVELDVNPVSEFIPYLAKAEEWQLEAVRKILDMPAKKICQSEEMEG